MMNESILLTFHQLSIVCFGRKDIRYSVQLSEIVYEFPCMGLSYVLSNILGHVDATAAAVAIDALRGEGKGSVTREAS